MGTESGFRRRASCNNRIFQKMKTVQKPWGSFEQFTHNEVCTVRIIKVNPGSALSLQYHNYRNEFWKILSGMGKFLIGNVIKEGKEGDEFFIPARMKHRVVTEGSPVV